MPIIFMC